MPQLKDCLRRLDSVGNNVNPLVDILAHISLCESNFARLVKLLYDEQVRFIASKTLDMGIELVPVVFTHGRISKYTSEVVIKQEGIDGIPDLFLKVRVYHDTRSAEVVAYQRHRDFSVLSVRPRSPRTKRMEKIEMNRFLTELLDYCFMCSVEDLENVAQGSSIQN